MYSYEELIKELDLSFDEGYTKSLLRKMLLENLQEETAKHNGSQRELTIIKKILKSAEKTRNEAMRRWSPVTVHGKEMKAFCEGHRAMITDNDFGIEVAEKPLKIQTLFDKDVFDEEALDYVVIGEEIYNDIKVFNKIHKTKKGYSPIPYIIETFGGEFIGFNPQFLIDAMDFCKSKELPLLFSSDGMSRRWRGKETKPKTLKSPFYFSNQKANRYAVVLPVNLVWNRDDDDYTINPNARAVDCKGNLEVVDK